MAIWYTANRVAITVLYERRLDVNKKSLLPFWLIKKEKPGTYQTILKFLDFAFLPTILQVLLYPVFAKTYILSVLLLGIGASFTFLLNALSFLVIPAGIIVAVLYLLILIKSKSAQREWETYFGLVSAFLVGVFCLNCAHSMILAA